MAHVAFTPNLARHVAAPDMNIAARDLRELLLEICNSHGNLKPYLLDDQSRLRKHVTIFIDGHQLTDRHGLSDTLAADSEVFIAQALSGG